METAPATGNTSGVPTSAAENESDNITPPESSQDKREDAEAEAESMQKPFQRVLLMFALCVCLSTPC